MKANGFTLLEVLIALVIFSFGLLALAALMAKGLQYNTSALYRSYASTQAYDMADRMRANRLGIDAGDYDDVSGSETDPDCISSGCNHAEMAQYDGWAWNSVNVTVLPGGSGTVKKKEGTDYYTISVSWDEKRLTDAGGTEKFEFEFQP